MQTCRDPGGAASSMLYRDLSLAGALLAITLFFPLHPDGGQFLSAQNLSNPSIEFAI